jgi:bifunctional non-homologous end joining protein LigD
MSLLRYQRMRDFSRTPEPAGRAPAVRSGRRYVVQRHRATRLHYDFRLEIDGVLVSWAVPKAPSMRAGERRMAARTEDHPIEYFDFEGVIPGGQYGAGDVIVWDWGTYEPEKTDDPARAVRAGELKFSLQGEKLRGRFTIVRTRADDPAKEQWLLIHKADEWADPDWDAERLPRSVKSGRTNDEIRAGLPAVWDSTAPAADAAIDLSAAREAPMPDFIAPMRATAVDGPFSDPDWVFEPKLDGYRVEAVVSDGRVRLWTRNRQDAARYFPDLAEAAPRWIEAQRAIVDGEVVALGQDGRPSFSLLQDRTGMRGLASKRRERRPRGATKAEDERDGAGAPLVYYVFDLLHLDGRSLLDVPLEDRKRLLRSLLRDHGTVRYLSHVETDGEAFLEAAREQRLEGMVAKLRHGRYESDRRSRSWLKVKVRHEMELVVGGWERGQGTHADLGSLVVGVYDGDRLLFSGHVGSGIDARTRRSLVERLQSMERPDPPFDDVPPVRGTRWVEPRLVIRAEYAEWTMDGLLRQASYKGLEPDRDPRSVHREREEPVASTVQAAERDALAGTVLAGAGPVPVGVAGAEIRPATDAAADDGAGAGVGRRTTAPRPRPRATGSGADRAAPRAPERKAADEGPDPAPTAPLPLVRAPEATGEPAEAVTADEIATLDAMRTGGPWQVGGHTVSLSNLDKVLFQGSGDTKRDLIRYYALVAPVMLPYLRDRPLNRHRWPNGVTGGHFWEKQIPAHAPTWVARWDYPEAGSNESHTYVVADRVATLVWLANMAAIDLHAWTSRAATYRMPTYALIDIDPGERTTWEQVVTFARVYRTALEHLGVRGFPKVTGKRGIQIWIPIRDGYTFEDTRGWVGSLSMAIGRTMPDLVSWEWEKSARRGRARLDYTQNALNKTLVAPYAVRPMPDASVSMPIEWDELDDPELRPDRWGLRSAVERIGARGDLFRPMLSLAQELPQL